jgi:hypothetical protein
VRRVEAMLDTNPPPVILKVYRSTSKELAQSPQAAGRVEVWYPKA